MDGQTTNTLDLSRQARRKERTRGALEAAARDLLITMGYEALTIQHITDRADLARATFYLYFRDRDEIVWAVLHDQLQTFDQVMRADTASAPGDARLHKWRLIFAFVDQHRDLLQVIVGERGHLMLARRVAAHIAGVIERDINAGLYEAITRQPVPIVAQFMAGALLQMVAWWLEHPDGYDAEAMSLIFADLVLREDAVK